MNTELKSMLHQRFALGILCAALVPACILFGLIGVRLGTNAPNWYMSISDTYYANSKMCMIGLLFATGVFFFTYKGYDWKDRLCSIVQAFCCMGIIAFPCKGPDADARVGLFSAVARESNKIHLFLATLLFVTFAINVLCLFTLGKGEPTTQKKRRNRIYRICGIIIVAFIVIQALCVTVLKGRIPSWLPTTLINEFFMLEAFAFAYIVKSEAIKSFNDGYEKVKVITKTEYVEVEKPVPVPVPDDDKISDVVIEEPTEPEEPTIEEPKEEEKPEETPTEPEKPVEPENVPESVIGFFQKIGIGIDEALGKIFKKKK